jgi:hypothetical protein
MSTADDDDDDRLTNNRVAQTHVWHEGQCWLVSTANRRCSAPAAWDSIYAETLVWLCDSRSGVGPLVWQGSSSAGDISVHEQAVRSLWKKGAIDDD